MTDSHNGTISDGSLLNDLDSFLNPKEPASKLNNQQIDLLESFLDSRENTMHLEVLDGFLSAIICGKEPIAPGEYLPPIFGGDMPESASSEQTDQIYSLITQHAEHIESLLKENESYYPFLYADPDGKCSANEWAYGFILGMELRRDSWKQMVEESKEKGLLTPVLSLYTEILPNATEIPAEEREDIVKELVENLPKIYAYYHA